MTELESRDQKYNLLYKSSKGQKEAPVDGSAEVDIVKGKEALMQVFQACVFIKRADKTHEKYCCDAENAYASKSH